MDTIKIEFETRNPVIEEATLVLYNIPAAGLASITGIDSRLERRCPTLYCASSKGGFHLMPSGTKPRTDRP